MKKLMIMSFMLVGLVGLQSCGSIKIVEAKSIEKVVKLVDKPQEDLYIRANTWMVENFNNAESVIQFSDKPNGIVTGKYLLSSKGVIGSGMSAAWENVYAIIKIQVKDNAAKITITPDSFGEYSMNPQAYSGQQAQTDVNKLITSFSDSIGKTESTDW
jgi:hypothetical protein